ncbi:hypothetical protein AAFC00_000654 [Neodothiora populina]|uniref:Uncharacterized protein n=1 Tax=Neodothiora populina TaxID=2781224 RepID=A0ABR3PDV1_9PEZI
MENQDNQKTQPWKAFKSTYYKSNHSAQPINYSYAKGQIIDNPGTAGEFNLSIEYDTEDMKGRRVVFSSPSSLQPTRL